MLRDGEVYPASSSRDYKATWQRTQIQKGMKNGVNNSIDPSTKDGIWIANPFCLVDSAVLEPYSSTSLLHLDVMPDI